MGGKARGGTRWVLRMNVYGKGVKWRVVCVGGRVSVE